MMKSFTYSAYGHNPTDIMKFSTNVPKPTAENLKPEQVLVQVHASSINYTDRVLMTGEPWLTRLIFGLRVPAYHPGCDFAGNVVAIGSKVTEYKVGDKVMGDVAGAGFGAWSEYVVAPQTSMTHKPKNFSYLEAACLPAAGTVALQAVRKYGKIQDGESVMINGAGGGVGHYALQISRALNPSGKITVYTSSSKMTQAKRLGADHAVDYKAKDFSKEGTKFDLVVDCFATNKYVTDLQKVISDDGGKYVQAGGSIWRSVVLGVSAPWVKKKSQTMCNFLVMTDATDLRFLAQLAEDGKLKPQISSVVSTLEELPKAYGEYMKGPALGGKIAIAISESAYTK